MGLFRRGTKLLRKGGSLRDCCCRDNPEECFCPDLCRYYWQWGGGGFVPATTLESVCINGCGTFAASSPLASPSITTPYGLITASPVSSAGLTPFYFIAGWFGPAPTLVLSWEYRVTGDAGGREDYGIGKPGRTPFSFFDPVAIYETNVTIRATPVCPRNPSEPPSWSYLVALGQGVSIGSRGSLNAEKTDLFRVWSENRSARFFGPAVCLKDEKLYCCPPLPQFLTQTVHLDADVEFTVNGEGVSAMGTFHPWISDFILDKGLDEWQVENEYPFGLSWSATIRRKASCLKQPYGECGSQCVLRAVVGDIESEFGACPDTELPAGWLLDEREGCDPDNAGLVPWLTVFTDPDAECESYQGLLGNEDYPLVCQDYISSGRTVNIPKVFGGYRSFFRSGYTVFPNEDNTAPWVQKSYNYEYEIFFSCVDDFTRAECELCDELTTQPKAWSIHVFFYAAVTETKWDVATQQVLYAERVSVRRLGTSPNSQQIVILASCEDTAFLIPRTEVYCPDQERPTGCVSVPELFPPVPVEISLSLHDGVTVNGNLFAWTTEEDEVDGEDIEDFPGDIKEPGGITIDLADRCCCFDQNGISDYCNPLP